jgi:hypothetical protein
MLRQPTKQALGLTLVEKELLEGFSTKRLLGSLHTTLFMCCGTYSND